MKARIIYDESPNIAASVKARRNPVVSESEEQTLTEITNEIMASVAVQKQGSAENSQTTKENLTDKKIINRNINKTVWSLEDKMMFFTALKNYGKNFGEISRFMKSRSRLNQKDIGKSKEQVRVFYVRTYNNIKTYIKFPSELPQFVQELYALINYGVFRTRIKKKLNSRLGEKLNELVNKGSTVIKANGKRITLRTPVCPALKRLNNINAPEQEYTIPDDVMIELVPRNYVTLWRVQLVQQNPRIRMPVALNRQLCDVISFLEERFKTSAELIRESLSMPHVSDTPKIRLKLVNPKKFYKEVVIREILKPRFDSITLKTYCDNNSKGIDKDFSKSNASTSSAEENNSGIKIDFYDMENKLLNGVGYEESCTIKVLSLYVALGCPETIRFEYDYLHSEDVEIAQNCITNGLRRLIHLSKNDYLENQQKKENKNKLEKQIDDMKLQIEMLKEEIQELEYRKAETDPSMVVAPTESPVDLDKGNPIVYKKQHEVMQQFLDDLPNKKNVVVRQLEYSKTNSSVNSMRQFNRFRRKQRITQKKPALIVQVPFSAAFPPTGSFTLDQQQQQQQQQQQHHQILQMQGVNNGNNVVASSSDMHFENRCYNQDSGPNFQTSTQILSQPMYVDGQHNGQKIVNNSQQKSVLDPNDNTNDSLHSLLNAVNYFVSEQGIEDPNYTEEDANSLFGSEVMYGLLPSEESIDIQTQINASGSGVTSDYSQIFG